jgi:GntR family transcriptional regulator
MVGDRFDSRKGNPMAPNGSELPDPRAYRRLAAMIRRDISEGRLRRGQPTPSITSLSREHGHARQTCSKVLRMLERERLVARFPGLGYYVC